MTTFDDRERGFEAKFAHDEETEFKVLARRDRLLALWAGAKLGLVGDDLENYVLAIWREDLKHAGDGDVVDKVAADFKAKGVAVSDAELQTRMHGLLDEARAQVEAG